MCLTCKSTVMVVTNNTSICKVANTKSPQLEYVAHILLFAIFFHLRFIFSRNILHETYIQKHKRPIFFWVIEVKMHFFWQFALFKFLKMFHIIVIIPPNKQTFTSTWNNCAKLSKRLWRSGPIQKIHHCLHSDNLLLLRKILQKKICSLHKTYCFTKKK